MVRAECLYCDKTFRDYKTLREHMRKKLHKKLNPSNTGYSRQNLNNFVSILILFFRVLISRWSHNQTLQSTRFELHGLGPPFSWGYATSKTRLFVKQNYQFYANFINNNENLHK